MDAIAEAIIGLQAGQVAQTRMLRAVISSHPNPVALRKAWRSFSAPSIADAEVSKISEPSRFPMHDALLQALQDWDAYLDRDLSRGASR